MSLLLTLLLGATAFDAAFDEGVAAYQNGDFDTAISRFETLVEQGVAEPELFFNLGNAYYRIGRLDAAIASYERALQLAPADANIRENLGRAVGRTERSLPKPNPPEWEQAFFFWHADLTGGRSLLVAATAWVLAWLAFGVRLYRPWPYLRMAGTGLVLVALLFLGSWWVKAHPEPLAIAARDRVPVRYGHRPAETVRFELHEGDRVRIDDRHDGWVRVETHDGERGWTEEANVYLVGPPYTSFRAQAAHDAPAVNQAAASDAPAVTEGDRYLFDSNFGYGESAP